MAAKVSRRSSQSQQSSRRMPGGPPYERIGIYACPAPRGFRGMGVFSYRDENALLVNGGIGTSASLRVAQKEKLLP
jgi:hypothetical protein